MADLKISQLNNLSSAAAGDLFVVVDIDEPSADKTKNITKSDLLQDVVQGPVSSTNNALAVFDGTTGALLKDSSILISDVGDVFGPASSVNDNIAIFDGATGKLIKDSGIDIGSLGGGSINGPGSSTDNAVVRWDGAGGTDIQDSGVTINDNDEVTIPGVASNGESIGIKCVTTLVNITAGLTVDVPSFFPQGCIIVGTSSRVVTTISGATTFDIGDPVVSDAYGLAVSTTAGTTTTTADWTIAFGPVYVVPTSNENHLRITANAGVFDGVTGSVRFTAYYLQVTAPSS